MKIEDIPLSKGRGMAFIAKLKDRNQITVDPAIVDLLKLEKGENYQFLIVVNKL